MGAQQAAVLVVVVAAVGEQLPRAPARRATLSPDRRHRLDQRIELRDVVAVAAGEGDRQRNATGVADQMEPRRVRSTLRNNCLSSAGVIRRGRGKTGPMRVFRAADR
jgi:hypothetical protein